MSGSLLSIQRFNLFWTSQRRIGQIGQSWRPTQWLLRSEEVSVVLHLAFQYRKEHNSPCSQHHLDKNDFHHWPILNWAPRVTPFFHWRHGHGHPFNAVGRCENVCDLYPVWKWLLENSQSWSIADTGVCFKKPSPRRQLGACLADSAGTLILAS